MLTKTTTLGSTAKTDKKYSNTSIIKSPPLNLLLPTPIKASFNQSHNVFLNPKTQPITTAVWTSSFKTFQNADMIESRFQANKEQMSQSYKKLLPTWDKNAKITKRPLSSLTAKDSKPLSTALTTNKTSSTQITSITLSSTTSKKSKTWDTKFLSKILNLKSAVSFLQRNQLKWKVSQKKFHKEWKKKMTKKLCTLSNSTWKISKSRSSLNALNFSLRNSKPKNLSSRKNNKKSKILWSNCKDSVTKNSKSKAMNKRFTKTNKDLRKSNSILWGSKNKSTRKTTWTEKNLNKLIKCKRVLKSMNRNWKWLKFRMLRSWRRRTSFSRPLRKWKNSTKKPSKNA